MSAITIYNNQNTENETLPQIFNFDGSQVRVVVDEKGIRIVDTLGGPQKMAFVNESGLYSLIFGSRKNEARLFKKWVTSNVLPAIRKTGSYGKEIDFNDTKLIHKLLVNYTDKINNLEFQVEIDKPKVDFYDDFINSEGLYNLQNAARALNCHPNLFIDLLKNQYLFYQGSALVPRQRYRTQGLFVVKSNIINNKTRYQTYITPKGLRYFAEHTYVSQANNDNSNYQSTIINY
jgi:anti-repressor protein